MEYFCETPPRSWRDFRRGSWRFRFRRLRHNPCYKSVHSGEELRIRLLRASRWPADPFQRRRRTIYRVEFFRSTSAKRIGGCGLCAELECLTRATRNLAGKRQRLRGGGLEQLGGGKV